MPSEVVEAYRERAVRRHQDDPEFGRRLLADEARDPGEARANRTAWRNASENGWLRAFGKPERSKRRGPGPPVHDDLCVVVDEDRRTRNVFAAEKPNELWLTDITEHKTAEGKLYLCAIKDVYSGRIVGYSIGSRMKSRLAVQALEKAVQMRGDIAGCIVHSDRGSQFRSGRCSVPSAGIDGLIHRQSRVERGQRGHRELLRAAAEERPQPALVDDREQLRIAVVTWIERTYHRRRCQARLGRLTPVEFEVIMNTPAALAA